MKTLFIFKPKNVVDIITNSSSELFVLKGETKEIVEEMISNVYPDYRNEYNEVKHISELSIDELNNYFRYLCSPHMWPASKSMYPVPDGFTFDELYEPEKDWETGKPKKPAWNGEVQYELRDNLKDKKNKWNMSFVTKKNYKKILDKLDPERKMFFLYSEDQNPNWEMQEKLMMIGERFHLG